LGAYYFKNYDSLWSVNQGKINNSYMQMLEDKKNVNSFDNSELEKKYSLSTAGKFSTLQVTPASTVTPLS